jgi:hypothetical protein
MGIQRCRDFRILASGTTCEPLALGASAVWRSFVDRGPAETESPGLDVGMAVISSSRTWRSLLDSACCYSSRSTAFASDQIRGKSVVRRQTQSVFPRAAARQPRVGGEWAAIWVKVMSRASWRCQACGVRRRLDGHHLVKRSQGRSDFDLNELVALCL